MRQGNRGIVIKLRQELTVALHMVPLGGTEDLLAQVKMAEAANSALVDALTEIPGLNLCKAPALIRRGVQAVKAYNMVSSGIQAATAVTNIIAELRSGGPLDIVTVIGEGRKAFVALMNLRRTAQIQTSCFGAGTPLRTLTGHKLIEEVCVGDVLLSRSEKDLDGPLAGKVVEQIFVRTGEIWHLHVGSEVIRTTAEHPFWVQGNGWVATNELRQGDLLASHDGQWVVVKEVFNTGVWEQVYNLRIGEFHTYFVGSGNWAFSVWAHNASYNVSKDVRSSAVAEAWKQEADLVRRTGQGIRNWTTKQIQQLLNTEKVRGYVGHHVNSVNDSPLFAGLPENIQFLTFYQHYLIHNKGRYKIPVYGQMLSR